MSGRLTQKGALKGLAKEGCIVVNPRDLYRTKKILDACAARACMSAVDYDVYTVTCGKGEAYVLSSGDPDCVFSDEVDVALYNGGINHLFVGGSYPVLDAGSVSKYADYLELDRRRVSEEPKGFKAALATMKQIFTLLFDWT